jgi:hypothetical protein
MTTIQQFKEIRRDGEIIDESMKAQDIFALGPTEKVIEVQWHNGSQPVSVRDAYGVLAKVVPGREFVATNGHDKSGQHRELSIINADGSRRLQLSNIQQIRANDEVGEFCWFESPRTQSPNVFGVVFSCSGDNSMFQMDIDATDGSVVGVYPMR